MKMLIAALALGSIAIPASAEEVQIEVRYDDLNLESPAGQKALDRRIDQAVNRACGAGAITGTRIPAPATKACVAQLKAKAGEQFAALVNESQLGG